MDTYNILTEPWMAVIDEQGKEISVGLRDFLVNAHKYKKSAENRNFPIVRRLQQRIAETFIMDIFGTDTDTLEELMDAGCFNPDIVDSYFKKCEQENVSFDLFNQERPFLQTDKITFEKLSSKKKTKSSVASINPRMCSGNNKVFFNPVSIEDYLNNTGAEDNRFSFYDNIYDSQYVCETACKVSFSEYINLLLMAQCISGMGGRGFAAGLISSGNRPPVLYQIDPRDNGNLFLSILMNIAFDDSHNDEKDRPMWRWNSYETGSDFLKKEGISVPKKMGMFFPIQYIYPDFDSIDIENKTISRIFKNSMEVADKKIFDKAKEKWIVDTEPSVSTYNFELKDKDTKEKKLIKKTTAFSEANRTWLDIEFYSNIYDGDAPKSLTALENASFQFYGKKIKPIMTAYYVAMDQAKYLSHGSFKCYLPSCILNEHEKNNISKEFIMDIISLSSLLEKQMSDLIKAFYSKKSSESIERNIKNRFMRYCEALYKRKFIPDIASINPGSNDYISQLNALLEKYKSDVAIYSYNLLYQIPIPYGKSIEAEIKYDKIRKKRRKKK